MNIFGDKGFVYVQDVQCCIHSTRNVPLNSYFYLFIAGAHLYSVQFFFELTARQARLDLTLLQFP